jgi:hypothetical protein
MTKEQLLQLVSEAYDEGAYVHLGIHHFKSEEEAGEVSDQFTEFFDSPAETDYNRGTGWHKYRSDKVELSTYFDKEETVCAKCQK